MDEIETYIDNTERSFERIIKEGGYKRLINIVENILLRPNDNKLLYGELRFNTLIKATERILEEYKDDPIYQYYYELPKVKHGFCTFERWKRGLLF